MNYGIDMNKTVMAEINEKPWRNLIEETIDKRLIEFNRSYWIVGFDRYPIGSPNTFSLNLDGFGEVHFKIVDKENKTGYQVIQILDTHWFDMGLTVGDVLTLQELLMAISVAKVKKMLFKEQE